MTTFESPAITTVPHARVRTLRGRKWMLVLVGASTLLGLVYPFPLMGRLWSQIFDLAHAPVFFLLLTACAGLVDPLSIGLSPRFVQLRKLAEREIMLMAVGCLLLGCAGEFLAHAGVLV